MNARSSVVLGRELEAHGHLVDLAFYFALENKPDEEVLDFFHVDIQLLQWQGPVSDAELET